MLVVVLGLLALTPMTWREKTVTNVKPTSWTGLRLELVPAGLLVYLSIGLAIAVAVVPLRRPLSVLLSAAGAITMAVLLLAQPGDTSATFNGFTQVTHYQWSAPPVVSVVFWLVLLAITARGENRHAVLLGCGVALPVLMSAGWQQLTVGGQAPRVTSGFGLLEGATLLWTAILLAPIALMALLIVLPATNFASTIVAATGLVVTVLNVWLAIPEFFNSGQVALSWLPAPYLSVLVWLIALAAVVLARVRSRG